MNPFTLIPNTSWEHLGISNSLPGKRIGQNGIFVMRLHDEMAYKTVN